MAAGILRVESKSDLFCLYSNSTATIFWQFYYLPKNKNRPIFQAGFVNGGPGRDNYLRLRLTSTGVLQNCRAIFTILKMNISYTFVFKGQILIGGSAFAFLAWRKASLGDLKPSNLSLLASIQHQLGASGQRDFKLLHLLFSSGVNFIISSLIFPSFPASDGLLKV